VSNACPKPSFRALTRAFPEVSGVRSELFAVKAREGSGPSQGEIFAHAAGVVTLRIGDPPVTPPEDRSGHFFYPSPGWLARGFFTAREAESVWGKTG